MTAPHTGATDAEQMAGEMAPDGFFSVDPQVLAIEIGDQAGIGFGGVAGPFHLSVERMIESAFELRERALQSRLAFEQSRADEAVRELSAIKMAAGESDLDFAGRLTRQVIGLYRYAQDNPGEHNAVHDGIRELSPIIQQHVASRLAPLVSDNAAIRKRLDDAVGQLNTLIEKVEHVVQSDHADIHDIDEAAIAVEDARAFVAREKGE